MCDMLIGNYAIMFLSFIELNVYDIRFPSSNLCIYHGNSLTYDAPQNLYATYTHANDRDKNIDNKRKLVVNSGSKNGNDNIKRALYCTIKRTTPGESTKISGLLVVLSSIT